MKTPRIGIMGARGIGQVHARIFNELGANVCAILGSSPTSVQRTATQLEHDYGLTPTAHHHIDDFLSCDLDAVSICTPAELHFEHLLAAANAQLAIFCEKPLFWRPEVTQEQLERQLARLEALPNRRIFVNTSNASFIDQLDEWLPQPASIKTFGFRFHTLGHHRGRDIASDLLPHGLSLLLAVFGVRDITDISPQYYDSGYRCSFSYGATQIDFDFAQDPAGTKDFALTIDGQTYLRQQKGAGASYRVLFQDSAGRELEVRDPFSVYIDTFLQAVRSGSTTDSFPQDSCNLRLMHRILSV